MKGLLELLQKVATVMEETEVVEDTQSRVDGDRSSTVILFLKKFKHSLYF